MIEFAAAEWQDGVMPLCGAWSGFFPLVVAGLQLPVILPRWCCFLLSFWKVLGRAGQPLLFCKMALQPSVVFLGCFQFGGVYCDCYTAMKQGVLKLLQNVGEVQKEEFINIHKWFCSLV